MLTTVYILQHLLTNADSQTKCETKQTLGGAVIVPAETFTLYTAKLFHGVMCTKIGVFLR